MNKGMAFVAMGLVIAAGSAAVSKPSHAATRTAPATSQCVATIGSPVMAGTASQQITVSLSEELQDSVSVDIPAESNLRVSRITRDMGAKTLKLEIDASNGAPGKWALTLKGKNASCKGELRVQAKS
jgi:hypothetical protein